MDNQLAGEMAEYLRKDYETVEYTGRYDGVFFFHCDGVRVMIEYDEQYDNGNMYYAGNAVDIFL